jgi:hypothetical protein
MVEQLWGVTPLLSIVLRPAVDLTDPTDKP